MQIANFAILKNPLNWLTVILMVVIAATAGHLFITLIGLEPATSNQ